MIKLHLSTTNSALNKFLPTKDFEVKSISAAWNKLREIRDLDLSTDTLPGDTNLLDGLLVTVDMGDLPISDRLPLEILFRVNTKGKVEFKNLRKVLGRAAKKEEAKAKAKAEKTSKEEELEKLSIQIAEELNED